ncbi:putative 2-oxoglutarate dehydrogenase e1 component, mitochondrial precursor, partial [Cardiosporidium cionae]
IERFLQLCDDREDVIHPENWSLQKTSVIQQHNIQVINCTTPSNMFHALRRQMHRGFRKPLIIFSPKQILKMRAAFCSIDAMGEGTRFQRYIADIPAEGSLRENVKRIILCSGQVYYALAAHRQKLDVKNIAIARCEQLSPFPFEKLMDDLKMYPNLEDIIWAQEEHMNAGPWFYTSKRIESCLRSLGYPNGVRAPVYVGRDVNAATAVGDSKIHTEETNQMLMDAFDLSKKTHSYAEHYAEKSIE